MPRSSRHKSSKHSSREARGYSDSERDSSFKEKKGREDGSVSIRQSKDSLSVSGEKRKALESKSSADNSKDLIGSGNVDFVEDYPSSSSKKRKEKVDDDRWTGGDNEEREVLRDEMSEKDSKGSAEAKSRSSRREEHSGLGGSKVEAKHHRSDGKYRSEKDGGSERERKSKDGNKSDKHGDEEVLMDDRARKGVGTSEERTKHKTESNVQDGLRTAELDRDSGRRVRRKKEAFGDVDKHHDCGGEHVDDGRSYLKDDLDKSGRYKDGIQRDERSRDKHIDVVDRDGKHHDEKPRDRDGCHARDYSHIRSNDKHLRADKKDVDVQQKKSRPYDGDHDYENDRGRYSRDDRDPDGERDRDKVRDRDRDRDHGYERGRDIDRGRDRDRDRDRNYRDLDLERGRDRDRDFTHERGREWDHDSDRDYNSHVDDRGSRYKVDRVRRRTSDDYDDHVSDKTRGAKAETKADRDRSLSRRPHGDAITSNSRGKSSPSSRSHGVDKYRDNEDFRHGDSLREVSGNSETHDKVSRYRSVDKRAKFDDSRLGDFSAERSPNTKASAMGLMERSPSSTSIDRKYLNISRSGRRRSLDVDESDRKSSGSNDVRDGSLPEERQNRDLVSQKPFVEDHLPVDSSFYQRSSQGPGFRGGVDSPFIGSMGEDNRIHSNRYRRSVDPNVGRAHGNPWKGVPNWVSPLSNGFMPFHHGHHGPPHRGFPPIIPQFPSPHMFGVRPSLEMSHSGIPFMSDADRFSGHVRPMGWQNMVDGSGPSHFPGWEANNVTFRDESSMYGGHPVNSRARDTNTEMWKQNGDVSMDEVSGPQRAMKAHAEEPICIQGPQGPRIESNFDEGENKASKIKTPNSSYLDKETPVTPKLTAEKTPDASTADNTSNPLRAYLSKLDISVDLAEPELYNQCLNVGVENQTDLVENQNVQLKDIPILTSQFSSSTLGITIFPAAEESIYQRTLDLYKRQCKERRSLPTSDGGDELLNDPELKVQAVDMVSDPNQGVDGLVHSSEQEALEPSFLPSDADMKQLPDSEPEVKEPRPAKEVGQEDYSPGSPGMAVQSPQIDNGDEAMEILKVEEVVDTAPEVLVEEDITEEGNLCVEVTSVEVTDSTSLEVAPNEATISNSVNAKENVVFESEGASPAQGEEELVGDAGAVNGSLNLADGSVKVCETHMSVTNVSESVILSRIHHAPESTH